MRAVEKSHSFFVFLKVQLKETISCKRIWTKCYEEWYKSGLNRFVPFCQVTIQQLSDSAGEAVQLYTVVVSLDEVGKCLL